MATATTPALAMSVVAASVAIDFRHGIRMRTRESPLSEGAASRPCEGQVQVLGSRPSPLTPQSANTRSVRARSASTERPISNRDSRRGGVKVKGVITAIVFISAAVDRIPEVAETIAQLPGVSEVYSVTGEIDLIALVRVRSHDDVADVVADRLNKVPGVLSTETHIAFRAYSRHDLESAFAVGVD
jgi:DNA-binding Lrp family transcriptional regulator